MWVFFPGNRSEVDDGYWYAQGIRDEDFIDLFNPRFLLFLPIMKGLYCVLEFIGVSFDAYLLMCTISMIFSGLVIVLLYDTLAAYLSIGKKTSLFASLVVLISYEFWRYSYEAEVYIISTFFIILIFRLFIKTKKQKDYQHVIIIGALCAFTTLLYKPNFIPLFIAFPIIYLYFGKIKQLLLFYSVGALIIVGSFLMVYSQSTLEVGFVEFLFGGTNTPTGKPYMAIFVVASNVFSVLWFFSNESLTKFIQSTFPHKVMEEEIFLSQQADLIQGLLISVTILFVMLTAFMMVRALIRKLVLTPYQRKTLGSLMIWLLVYAIFLLFMDPSSNEPWLMIQIPLLVGVSVIFVKPLKSSKLWLPYSLLFLLFINNYFGGIWLLQDPVYDYNKRKAEWLQSNAGSNDIILSYGPISFIRYLRYTTSSEVISIEEELDGSIEALKYSNGRLFITNGINNTPSAIYYRSADKVNKFRSAYKSSNLKIRSVNRGNFATYELIPND